MNLHMMARKLRNAANAIDELLIETKNENIQVATKILKKKKKIHWMQMPKNRARVMKAVRKMRRVNEIKNKKAKTR